MSTNGQAVAVVETGGDKGVDEFLSIVESLLKAELGETCFRQMFDVV